MMATRSPRPRPASWSACASRQTFEAYSCQVTDIHSPARLNRYATAVGLSIRFACSSSGMVTEASCAPDVMDATFISPLREPLAFFGKGSHRLTTLRRSERDRLERDGRIEK